LLDSLLQERLRMRWSISACTAVCIWSLGLVLGTLAADNCEARLDELQSMLENIESNLVSRYGLTRICAPIPDFEHGSSTCSNLQSSQLKAGTKCRAACEAGYIGAVNQTEAVCQEDGTWSTTLLCEEPLVAVAGSKIGNKSADTSVEVIDFQGKCEASIPDMIHGRSDASLFYNEGRLISCFGGAFEESVGSRCESWKPGQATWEAFNTGGNENLYTTGAVTLNGASYVLGGWSVSEEKKMVLTDKILKLSPGSINWKNFGRLEYVRSHFCIVKVDEKTVVMIGGYIHSTNEYGTNFTDAVEQLSITGGCSCGNEYRTLAPLPEPMAKVECSLMPGGQDILVTGGASIDGEVGMAKYIYNLESDAWTVANPTVHHRWGHEMVTVGKNMYVFGGGWDHRVSGRDAGDEDPRPDPCEDHEKDFTAIEKLDYTSNPQSWNWQIIGKKLKKDRFHAASVLIPRSLFPECI